MKKPVFNPYLPHWEFIPDGEPHVFEGRLYLYGSHDDPNISIPCPGDYVVWSAPVDDLGNWRYDGVSYRKDQDPINGAPYGGVIPELTPRAAMVKLPHHLYAPDVAQGPDGRYYLYYSLDCTNVISVAVSDSPAGPFDFLDFVRTADGVIPDVGIWFDPAIYCEESGNYLYYGFAPNRHLPEMCTDPLSGAFVVKLADDMHTIISEPVRVANGPGCSKDTSYEAHPFFEAPSVRKIDGRYYFVYSSIAHHELCYGTADSPEGPFVFGGVIISNVNLGYKGSIYPANYISNNHGGLVQIGDQVYIFAHRHTHGTCLARQGIAEKVTIWPDGSIPQVEFTSCGLNNGPLPAKGTYQSHIACHLTEKDRAKMGPTVTPDSNYVLPEFPPHIPYITEEENMSWEMNLKPYIANMQEGCTAGYKYLAFDGSEQAIVLELRGNGSMKVTLDDPNGPMIAELSHDSAAWSFSQGPITKTTGTHALYVTVTDGKLDFASFSIS